MLGQVVLKNPRAVVGAAAFAVGLLAYITKPSSKGKHKKRPQEEDDDDLPYKIRREGPITKTLEPGEAGFDDKISEVSEHSGSSENSGEVYSDYYREHPDHNRTPQRAGKKGTSPRERQELNPGKSNSQETSHGYDRSVMNERKESLNRSHFDTDDQEDDRYSYKSSYYASQTGRSGNMKRSGLGRPNTKASKIMKLHRHFESSDAEGFDSESTFPNSAFDGSDIDSHYRDGNHRGKILYSRDGKRMRRLQYHSDFEVNRMDKSQKLRNKQKLIKMVRNEKELKGTDGIFFDIIGQYMKKGEGLKVNNNSSSTKR